VEPESNLGRRYAERWDSHRHPELARAVRKHELTWPGITHELAEEQDMTKWTGTDTAQAHEAYDETLTRRGSFHVPGGDEALAKLKAIAQDIIDNPHGGGPPEPGEAPNPLPPPFDAVIDWLDAEEAAGRLRSFYLTEDIAAGIGYPEPARLGRLIWRDVRIKSRQAVAEEGGGGRKGYDVRVLREAAARVRFGL